MTSTYHLVELAAACAGSGAAVGAFATALLGATSRHRQRLEDIAFNVLAYQEDDDTGDDDVYVVIRNEASKSITQLRLWQLVISGPHRGSLCLIVDGPIALSPSHEVTYVVRFTNGEEFAVSYSDQRGSSWLRWVSLPQAAGLAPVWLDLDSETISFLRHPRPDGGRYSWIRRVPPEGRQLRALHDTEVRERLYSAFKDPPWFQILDANRQRL
ncbi:MAG: hypothetical protein M0005_06165 [Actinomycetota bacterium]|jgi:hypothetical protein|nr:hypothetical protein [Actinomycetota bacterium]